MNLEEISLADLLMRRRTFRRELSARPNLQPLRVAVLGGSTTSSLVELWELLLLAAGFAPVFHQSEYGRYYEDVVHDPQSLIDF